MRIHGLGVIVEASVELHSGLTVLTGETGAGKTMVVTGLHLLSGARADAAKVRTGSPRAVVEGRFTLQGPAGAAAAAVTEGAGAQADEDGSVIAVRTVGTDGRSRAHLGGRSVPAGVLAEFTGPLLTVHGQNDQLRLQRPGEQRAALDRSANGVAPLLHAYQQLRDRWQHAVRDLAERTGRSRELAREADVLNVGLADIADVDPQPGEDSEIARSVRRLGDLDALRAGAAEAQAALVGDSDGESGGALERVAQARTRLAGAEDDALSGLGTRLDEVVAVLTDVAGDLGGYLSDLPVDGAALDSLMTRQAELRQLTRKYAADTDGVLTWAEQARARLAEVDVSDSALSALANERDELAVRLAAAAVAVTRARQEAATELAGAVSAELAGLAMGQAQLQVVVAPRSATPEDPAALEVDGQLLHVGAHGVDDVELRLAAHPGAPALPLGRSASGGELSRVMLALEVVLATADTTATLVFDEVDAGVGGRAAVEVGRRLARLARTHQVVVVTHLPQVAAFADCHLVVEVDSVPVDEVGADGWGSDLRSAAGAVTISGVRTLSAQDRVAELARMLAGLDETETGRAHAEELLAVAAQDRSRD